MSPGRPGEPVPLPTVTLYHAAGCHLCDRALEVVTEAKARRPFNLELVDISGDDALERTYREQLPVIEIDGIPAFTYFVSVGTLLDRLADDGSRGQPPERQAICDILLQGSPLDEGEQAWPND